MGKRDAGIPSVQGGVQSVDSGGNPLAILSLTDAFSATVTMTSGSEGTLYSKDLNTLVKLSEGNRLAIGWEANGARITYGMRQAADNPSDANNLFYYRSSSGLPPTDGYSSTSYEGWLSVWVDAETNVAPDIPATVTVAGLSSTSSGSPSVIGTYTPTIVAIFRDDNESVGSGPVFGIGQADKIRRGQYQIYDATNALVYDSGTFNATSAEQAARQFSRVYDGPALVAGTVYHFRTRVWDQFDAASDWSAYRYFTIAAGDMDTSTTPTGKQETKTPSPFAATWRHPSLSTNAVQIHIHDAETGTLLRDSGTITKTVARNAVSSVTWATTGFAPLPAGTKAYWEMRGRDTSGVWGSFSDGMPFTVDASPTTPVNVTPVNNAAFATPPKLTVKSTDEDDTVATGLVVKSRVMTDPVLVNPGFATNVNGWMLNADIGLVTEAFAFDALNGYDAIGGSGKITLSANTNPAGNGPVYRTVRRLSVVPGQSYSMQIAVRTDNANLHPRANLRFYDATDTLVSGGSISEADWTPTINTWYLRSLSVAAPATATYVYLGVFISFAASSQNGNIWIDDADFTGNSVRAVAPMTLRSGTTDTWDVQLTAGASASWTVTKSGTVSGGTYTLTDPETGINSGALAATATAAATQTALESVYGVGNVSVTGGPLTTTALTITMRVGTAGTFILPPTLASSLTGGGTAVVATVTAGGGGHLNGYGPYTWDAYSGDGTFWSGDVDWANEGSAANSSNRQFVYSYGPQPSITAPVDGSSLSTATPTITYTVAGPAQVSRRIKLYRDGILIHDHSATTASTSYTVPTPLSTGELLHELDAITIEVTVYDVNGLSGTATVDITIDFPTPATLQPTAELSSSKGDITPTTVRIRWPQTAYPLIDAGAGAFLYYRLSRRPSADAIAANPKLNPKPVLIAKITTPSRVSWTDHTAQSNVEYIYRLTQYVLVNGVDVLNSLAGEATISVNFQAIVIHDERDPDGTRIVLAVSPEVMIRQITNVQTLKPWGQAAPVHLRDNTFYHEVEFEAKLITRSDFYSGDIIRRGEAMLQNGGPLVYRDGQENVYWGELLDFKRTKRGGGGIPVVHVLFRELAHQESDE
jgi:hypothetical protein